MKKILICSNDLSVGGIQKSLYNLLKNINTDEYEIDVCLMNDNNFFQDKISPKINIYYFKKFPTIRKFIFFKINKFLSKCDVPNKEYDVAIDFDGYQQQTAINVLKCNAKKKIMWIHSDWIERPKYDKKFKINLLLSKSKNKYFDEYVGVSNGVIESFKKIIKKENIKYTIIPNIIDSSEIIKKSKEKCDLKVDNNKYNFCSVGRLCISKGFDILINYINELRKYRSDFHLYIIGDGEEKNNLEKLVIKYNLQEFITFLGVQKNPFKYMNLMDGFILTSRFEGQGMVLLEAKTLGLEIFMTKNLEKYNNNLVGYEDIISAMINATKKDKIINTLNNYNKDIIKKIDKLLS